MTNQNFKVVVRVKPLETAGSVVNPTAAITSPASQLPLESISTTQLDSSRRTITLRNPSNLMYALSYGDMALATSQFFTFDYVHDTKDSQEDVFRLSAEANVQATLKGYHATIMAYGQTGSGKTYTMLGDTGASGNPNEVNPSNNTEFDPRDFSTAGIIPRAVDAIFREIENDTSPESKYLVRVSYLQIYNEAISDLLKPDRTNLVIREDARRGVYVDGLSEWVVRSRGEVHSLLQQGSLLRRTSATRINELSSRSHAVFIIIVEHAIEKSSHEGSGDYDATDEEGEGEQDEEEEGEEDAYSASRSHHHPNPERRRRRRRRAQVFRVGKLNLVDLAGSERLRATDAKGQRLEESKKINQSLSALGNVISALTGSTKQTHIPYRDSKLTRLLEDSIGGNCMTTMMATISPAQEFFGETLSTLKFAHRAKSIQNEAHVNEDCDQKTLLRKYERELRELREEVAKRKRTLVDKRQLLALEEEKRQAEEDKLAALSALEAQSLEVLREKAEKAKLEERIRDLQGQLLGGRQSSSGGGSGGAGGLGKAANGKGEGRASNGKGSSGSSRHQSHASKAIQQSSRGNPEGGGDMMEVAAAVTADMEGQQAQQTGPNREEREHLRRIAIKQRDVIRALTRRLYQRDEQILGLQEEIESYDQYERKLEDALDAKTAQVIGLRKQLVQLRHQQQQQRQETKPPPDQPAHGASAQYLESTVQHHHHSWESSNPLTVSTQSASGRIEAEKAKEQDPGQSVVPPRQTPSIPPSSQSPSSSRLINQFVKDLSEEVVAVKGILDKQIRSQVETIEQLAVGTKSKELKTQIADLQNVIVQVLKAME